MKPKERIALVTGASRGVGRGVALALGEAGATVYLTARTSRQGSEPVPGTIEAVASEVDRRGGKGIPVRCDHAVDAEVGDLFRRIEEEAGRLDVLVNNAYSGVGEIAENVERRFWEMDPGYWDRINRVGLRGHYVATVHGARLMVKRHSGLIVNISSLGGLSYLFSTAYGVGKAALDRMTADMAVELGPEGVAVVSLWPGFVGTELVRSLMEEAKPVYRRFFEAYSETPLLTGRAVAGLAGDARIMRRTGRVLVVAELARAYGFREEDGSRPSSPRSLRRFVSAVLPPPWQALSRIVPPVKVPRWLVRRVLRRLTSSVRRDGGLRAGGRGGERVRPGEAGGASREQGGGSRT